VQKRLLLLSSRRFWRQSELAGADAMPTVKPNALPIFLNSASRGKDARTTGEIVTGLRFRNPAPLGDLIPNIRDRPSRNSIVERWL
jgi:hypothetical protein